MSIARKFLISVVLAWCPVAVAVSQAQVAPQVVDPALTAAVSGGREASYLVYLKETADLSAAIAAVDRDTQGLTAYRALKDTADRTQAPLLAYLSGETVAGRASVVKSFFSANVIGVTSGSQTLAGLAAFPQVDRIIVAPVVSIPEPAPGVELPKVDAVEWNIAKVRAPEVWARGIRGLGIVVANIDTGVTYTHTALVNQYRGNLGGGSFNHNYNWWDPSLVCGNPSLTPCDNNNHGTHTMGTMVGNDGGANQIGVAPAAKWISCKGCESGNCSGFALLECADFILAPWDLNHANADATKRPHIVNNSWGDTGGDGWYRQVVVAWRAAGIFPAFSIGNSGPACGTAGSPGDYPESFASGATDINDGLASFSSRGPSAFGGITKPDIASPGANVRSSIANGGYASFNGTSMASPHTAGIVALLWSEYAGLLRDVANTERKLRPATVILNSAQGCGGDGPRKHPNNGFGSGRADAYRAINAFSVYTNQVNYDFPDQLQAFLSLVNPHAASLTGDFYLGIVTPAGYTIQPLGQQTLPGLVETFDNVLVNQPFGGGPSGTYAFFTIIAIHGTNPLDPANIISVDVAPFQFP